MPIENDFANTEFSVQTAFYLVNACQAAYLNELGDWAVELALGEKAATFSFGPLNGFVADTPTATLLAFRGTDNPENWLTDFQATQITDPAYTGKVHCGFARALQGIWQQLTAMLPAASVGRPLWVTGHSLGAGLATLASVRLLNAGYDVRPVHTFGSPRVGDLEFFDAYLPISYRWVNNNDVVPHVPLEQILTGVPNTGLSLFRYKHVGTLKYLDRQGRLGEGTSNWETKKEFLLDVLARNNGAPEPAAVADHHIGNYVEAIKNNL